LLGNFIQISYFSHSFSTRNLGPEMVTLLKFILWHGVITRAQGDVKHFAPDLLNSLQNKKCAAVLYTNLVFWNIVYSTLHNLKHQECANCKQNEVICLCQIKFL